jgi:carbon storage regulator
MLVLTRSANQTIIIGDDIVIKVIKTKSGSVKLGIEAPRDRSVRRGELPPEPPTTPKQTWPSR